LNTFNSSFVNGQGISPEGSWGERPRQITSSVPSSASKPAIHAMALPRTSAGKTCKVYASRTHELRNEIDFDQAPDFWNQNGKIECILLWRYSRAARRVVTVEIPWENSCSFCGRSNEHGCRFIFWGLGEAISSVSAGPC